MVYYTPQLMKLGVAVYWSQQTVKPLVCLGTAVSQTPSTVFK